MTLRLLATAIAAATLLQTQTFRTGTDLVLVDVSVRDGRNAVLGLTADDFVLTDNGVRQRIDSVEASTVPIDVTLVVDLSGHPGGTWADPPSRSKVIAVLQREVGEVTKILRPEDRIRLLAVDTSVYEVFPMQAPANVPAITRIEFDGMSSLYEGLAAALLYPTEPARRHVVIARTKGVDTISSVPAPAVAAIAQQSDALFHLVLMESAADNETAFKAFQCQFIGLCLPTRKFWTPFRRRLAGGRPRHLLTPDGQLLATAADGTGGGFHKTEVINEPTLTGTFRKAFEDFRNSYVLRYTVQGVAQTGWHRIDVRVPRSNGYTVRARRGYLVEPPPGPAAPYVLPSALEEIGDFTAAYERNAFRDVVNSLRATKAPIDLLHAFDDGGNPWPANPRMEAAFALELAEPGLFAADARTRDTTKRMIDRFTRLVRHPLEPDTFERYWYFAALTTLEGSMQPRDTLRVAGQALERFPDEPRFLLSRAIAADQAFLSRPPSQVHKPQPGLPDANAIDTYYEQAMTSAGTAPEARIRHGFFFHRTGRQAQALAQLQAAVPPAGDTDLRYLQQLFLGHVLWHLKRSDEAMAAYRAAQAIVPDAQSARVALMNALLLTGDREGAEALAEQVQGGKTEQMDPWWAYWQGQYRMQPQAMARVRELSR
jgi:VWFA-related protein